ncbi:hypothetical protein E2C01_005736 [Portunus trituberculatus]|uniref:Uncharacterized protein n=1 Tax=Portunus trituberculatus TaxID=210409 RepID=A0A5B7CV29_PORTR|nr:hypothetical protein [Portunus trituberculatus]
MSREVTLKDPCHFFRIPLLLPPPVADVTAYLPPTLLTLHTLETSTEIQVCRKGVLGPRGDQQRLGREQRLTEGRQRRGRRGGSSGRAARNLPTLIPASIVHEQQNMSCDWPYGAWLAA